MLDYRRMSTATLSKMVTYELRSLASADNPKKVRPSDRDAFLMEHEGKLQQIDAVLRARELGEVQ
ncbi:hypothetical protein [Thermophilibacter sp.]